MELLQAHGLAIIDGNDANNAVCINSKSWCQRLRGNADIAPEKHPWFQCVSSAVSYLSLFVQCDDVGALSRSRRSFLTAIAGKPGSNTEVQHQFLPSAPSLSILFVFPGQRGGWNRLLDNLKPTHRVEISEKSCPECDTNRPTFQHRHTPTVKLDFPYYFSGGSLITSSHCHREGEVQLEFKCVDCLRGNVWEQNMWLTWWWWACRAKIHTEVSLPIYWANLVLLLNTGRKTIALIYWRLLAKPRSVKTCSVI